VVEAEEFHNFGTDFLIPHLNGKADDVFFEEVLRLDDDSFRVKYNYGLKEEPGAVLVLFAGSVSENLDGEFSIASQLAQIMTGLQPGCDPFKPGCNLRSQPGSYRFDA